MNVHADIDADKAARKKFRTDLQNLCLGQHVAEVFIAGVSLLLASVTQRTNNKRDAMAMLGVASAGMMRELDENYEILREVADGAQHIQ